MQQDPAKLSISDRLRQSSKKQVGFDESIAEAICFMVTEKSYDLKRLRELDIASFMVLLEYLEEQGKKTSKGMPKKGKK